MNKKKKYQLFGPDCFEKNFSDAWRDLEKNTTLSLSSLNWSPDGRMIFSSISAQKNNFPVYMISGMFTYDGKFIWDIWVSKKPYRQFSDSAWSPNSKQIALSDGWNDKISIFDVDSKKLLSEIDIKDMLAKYSFSQHTRIEKIIWLE